MKPQIVALSLASMLTIGVTSCGSSTVSRSTLAKSFVAEVNKGGDVVDEGCVTNAFGKFTDADMTVIDQAMRKDATPTGLSADGQALLVELLSCTKGIDGVTIPAAVEGLSAMQTLMLTQMMETFKTQGLNMDEDCLRAIVEKLDNSALTNQSSAAMASIGAEAIACVRK